MMRFVLLFAMFIAVAGAHVNAQPLPQKCQSCGGARPSSVWDERDSVDTGNEAQSYRSILDNLKGKHGFTYQVEPGTGSRRVLETKIQGYFPKQPLRDLITKIYTLIGAPVRFEGSVVTIIGNRLPTQPAQTAAPAPTAPAQTAPEPVEPMEEPATEEEELPPPPAQASNPAPQIGPRDYSTSGYVHQPGPPPTVAPRVVPAPVRRQHVTILQYPGYSVAAPIRSTELRYSEWSYMGRDEFRNPIYAPKGSRSRRGYSYPSRGRSRYPYTGRPVVGRSGYGYGYDPYMAMARLEPCAHFPDNRDCTTGGIWVDGPSARNSEEFLKQFHLYRNGQLLGPLSLYNRKPNKGRPVPTGPCKIEIKYRYNNNPEGETPGPERIVFSADMDIMSYYELKGRGDYNKIAFDNLNVGIELPKPKKKEEKKDDTK